MGASPRTPAAARHAATPPEPLSQPAPGVPWRRAGDRLTVRFRVTPRASRTFIAATGLCAEGPAFLAKLHAVPEDGAANDALLGAVSGWLGLPRSSVTLVAGTKSRIKLVALSGDADILESRLAEQWAILGGGR